MKVIDLLNKIANGELENNTRFRDKYTQKEYVFKPNSYAGIYPPDSSKADENWLLSLRSGWFRLDQEVEIIEEDKKIRKLDFIEENTFSKIQNGMTSEDRRLLDSNFRELGIKINEIIDKLNEGKE